MKIVNLKALIIALFPLILWSCATATATSGKDFDSSKVNQIEKNVTTTAQIVRWLGTPETKEAVSATEEKWNYGWATATAQVRNGHTHTTGFKKNLSLFIKDGIVVNYSYNEGPFEKDVHQGH